MIPAELTADLDQMRKRSYQFELTEADSRIYIVFKAYPLPPKLYNMESCDVMVYTSPFYPNAGFDMFWTEDRLLLKTGGQPRNGDQFENYINRRWRRFSYHPYNGKLWNPAEDSIIRHMQYVDQRLSKGD